MLFLFLLWFYAKYKKFPGGISFCVCFANVSAAFFFLCTLISDQGLLVQNDYEWMIWLTWYEQLSPICGQVWTPY